MRSYTITESVIATRRYEVLAMSERDAIQMVQRRRRQAKPLSVENFAVVRASEAEERQGNHA